MKNTFFIKFYYYGIVFEYAKGFWRFFFEFVFSLSIFRIVNFIFYSIFLYMKKQFRWFTLVELIVVVTILAILGTIAFLSFQNYSRNSRDSVRVSDFFNIGKGLELFVLKVWRYPIPDDAQTITYSGWALWIQWEFWEWVQENVGILNKLPVDPLLGTQYTYSVIHIRDEYQLWWILEAGSASYNPLFDQANAASSYAAVLKWNYNGKILKTATGGTDYVLAIPTITATDLDTTDIEDIIAEGKLVYSDYFNIPSSYNATLNTGTGWFDFTTTQLVVYSWSVDDLSTSTGQVIFAENLQKAYSGTVLALDDDFREEIAIDTGTAEETAKNVVKNYLNNTYGGLVTGGTYEIVSTTSTPPSATGSTSCVFWTSTFPCDL